MHRALPVHRRRLSARIDLPDLARGGMSPTPRRPGPGWRMVPLIRGRA